MQSQVEPDDIDAPPPIFLFGLERSGTTLLSMMIGAHPEIAVPLSTTGLWYRYGSLLARYNHLKTMGDVECMVKDLLQEERIRLWDVELRGDEVLKGLVPGSYARVIARFHSVYARYKGKTRWGNIDISTLDHMDIAYHWFPNARFVHIVRDGRDVALSHETMPYGASNVAESADMWMRRLQVNLKMGAILGRRRYVVVRYEDLILATEDTLRHLCDFMGVAYAPEMLEYPKMVEEKVPEERRWLWPALNHPPLRSNVFRWKMKMSPTKRIVFEGVANAMLRELGYEAYEEVPKRLLAYLYELWYFLGRGGRVRRLSAKLGIRRLSKLEREWRATRRLGSKGQDYQAVQQQAFSDLIGQGIYSAEVEHAPQLQRFVEDCLRTAVDLTEAPRGLSILECGCGTGAWLDFLARRLETTEGRMHHYYGFDLTPGMIEVARQRLGERIPPDHLHQGDILQDASYLFNDAQAFDLIYAYDVIQQLPPRLQLAACKAMLHRLAPGGVAVIFDSDRHSLFGLKMGMKKFMTQYLKIRLVPEYFCNASYPPLLQLSHALRTAGSFATEIRVAPDPKKRALIIRSLAAATHPESIAVHPGVQ
jgi:SAM-dependent methyltransferase